VSQLRAFVLLPLLAGCSAVAPRQEVVRAAPPPDVPGAGVIYVANGAGDTRGYSEIMTTLVADSGAPLRVETFVWSHGPRRVIADHVDHDNHLNEGERLATEVAVYRQAHPGQRVMMAGHSSGIPVLLAAAERLPADSVERIVLLAPSVCTDYDLRPALRASRRGIDVFYSQWDMAVLGVAVGILGTSDRDCRRAAGRHGFTPVVESPADRILYQRLRQYPWEQGATWTGNTGGHYGSIEPQFLRAYVLPRMLTPG
jgi:pimeloyl-ACP methyl ester carboxylesterase